MTGSHLGSNGDDFYRLRDSRTAKYLTSSWQPSGVVRVAIDPAAAGSEAGQHLMLSLTNLLARAHRRILFSLPDQSIPLRTFALVEKRTLQEAVLATARTIDPFGTFDIMKTGGDITLGIGSKAEPGLDWYLGADRANGYLRPQASPLNTRTPSSLRGVGVAACLGAAAAFKMELGLPVIPRLLSAWSYMEGDLADPGPQHLDPLNVGRVLMVGAGAVASALVYWLRSWGVEGEWIVVDRDTVKIHNTNRGMLFLPGHTGWPSGPELTKAPILAELLPRARPIEKWYNEAAEIHNARFDLVLALANDYGVREVLAHRNAVVLLHATTGRNWLSQLHRHVGGRDDCLACRLGDVKEVAFACSTAQVETPNEERMDAALPFLSAGAGLMLATLLQRLQAGVITEGRANNWRWDFLSDCRMAAPPGRSRCRAGCANWYTPSVRTKANAATQWAHLDAAANA